MHSSYRHYSPGQKKTACWLELNKSQSISHVVSKRAAFIPQTFMGLPQWPKKCVQRKRWIKCEPSIPGACPTQTERHIHKWLHDKKWLNKKQYSGTPKKLKILGWASGTVVRTLLGRLASPLCMPELESQIHCGIQVPANVHPDRYHVTALVLRSRVPMWDTKIGLLVSNFIPWTSAGFCRNLGNAVVNGNSVSFSFFPSISLLL